MDANKAKDVNNKVPPVIWEATYEFTSDAKTIILDDAKREFPLLLNSFPVISWQLNLAYYDWGIYVDKGNPNKIVKLIPDSFAEKIGLQENDIITMVRKENKSPKKYRYDPMFIYHSYNKGLKPSQEYKDDPMFHLHVYDYLSSYISKITVERGGKSKTIAIKSNAPQPSLKRIVMSKPLQ